GGVQTAPAGEGGGGTGLIHDLKETQPAQSCDWDPANGFSENHYTNMSKSVRSVPGLAGIHPFTLRDPSWKSNLGDRSPI
ncbi:MAG: hypothetical protein ABFD51_02145, partial [Anaerolineaceae bacterium]